MKVVKVTRPDVLTGYGTVHRGRPRIMVFWWANWRCALLDAFRVSFPTAFDGMLVVEDSEDVQSWGQDALRHA